MAKVISLLHGTTATVKGRFVPSGAEGRKGGRGPARVELVLKQGSKDFVFSINETVIPELFTAMIEAVDTIHKSYPERNDDIDNLIKSALEGL